MIDLTFNPDRIVAANDSRSSLLNSKQVDEFVDGAAPQTHDPYAENAALKADAERYRWLRNHNPTRYALDLGADIIDINCKEDGQHELDAAIDAAMKEAS